MVWHFHERRRSVERQTPAELPHDPVAVRDGAVEVVARQIKRCVSASVVQRPVPNDIVFGDVGVCAAPARRQQCNHQTVCRSPHVAFLLGSPRRVVSLHYSVADAVAADNAHAAGRRRPRGDSCLDENHG
jgi:hypothetical protein